MRKASISLESTGKIFILILVRIVYHPDRPDSDEMRLRSITGPDSGRTCRKMKGAGENIINRCRLALPAWARQGREGAMKLDCRPMKFCPKRSYFSLSDRRAFFMFFPEELITYAVYSNPADFCQREENS